MSSIKIYQTIYHRLIKLSMFVLIIAFCAALFFTAKRVRGPLVAFGLFDYLRDLKVDSVLFECLDNSFVPWEIPRRWEQASPISPSQDYGYFKYSPKYQPLLNIKTLLPAEMYLTEKDEVVPFVRPGLFSKSNIFWTFVIDKKNKIYSINASQMIPAKDMITRELKDGLMLYTRGSIHRVIELSEGPKEFSVFAADGSNFESNAEVDSSPQMVIHLDNITLGDTFVRGRDPAEYNFQYYTNEGWHRLEIAFVNDYYNTEKKPPWDRNLLLQKVEIRELSGTAYLNVKKLLEDRYLPGDYAFTYFRALPQEDKNELIRFFKSRFNIENLKDIVTEGYSVNTLIKDVEIANLTKRAIFTPAPTKIKLKVKVPVDGIKCVFGLGVMEEAWDKPGDGVEFKVRLDTGEEEPEVILFSRYINPKVNEADRKWFQAEVDLRRFKGKEIDLIFETKGSPISPITPTIDDSYDWAVWSE